MKEDVRWMMEEEDGRGKRDEGLYLWRWF